MNLYLRGGGSQISTTLDSVTERWVLCEFFWVQTVIFLQETRTLILITNRALFTWKEMKVDTHLIETLQKRLIADAQVITLS